MKGHSSKNEKDIIFDKFDGFKIIESLYNSEYGGIGKCFTFFNHLCERSKNLKINLSYLAIDFNASLNWFPIDIFKEVDVYLHSPNNLPNKEDDSIHLDT